VLTFSEIWETGLVVTGSVVRPSALEFAVGFAANPPTPRLDRDLTARTPPLRYKPKLRCVDVPNGGL